MKLLRQQLLFGLIILGVWGCEDRQSTESAHVTSVSVTQAAHHYDRDSWKSLIGDDCQSYFDGCNNCVRGEKNELTRCTRKACQVYQKPHCLDLNSDIKRVIKYQCMEGGFTVYIGEFPAAKEVLVLEEGNIVIQEVDGTATLLTRMASGSGERYKGGGLIYWNKGDNALVHKNDQPLYRQCVSDQVNDEVLSQ